MLFQLPNSGLIFLSFMVMMTVWILKESPFGQLETVCAYKAQADQIARDMTEKGPHSYEARSVIVNTAYPHAHGEYSV